MNAIIILKTIFIQLFYVSLNAKFLINIKHSNYEQSI